MNTHKKTISCLTVITILLGLNLAVVGKARAQVQMANLVVEPGQLTLVIPASVSFPKTVLVPGADAIPKLILDPTNSLRMIQLVDPSNGGTFHVNLTVQNLSDSQNNVLLYSDIGFVTLHANQPAETVDSSSINSPAGSNNVSSPSQTSLYFNPNANQTTIPDNVYTAFPVNPLDPDPGSSTSVSSPVTLMERTVNTVSSGIYSVGLALRATIAQNSPLAQTLLQNTTASSTNAPGNFSGELIFTLDP